MTALHIDPQLSLLSGNHSDHDCEVYQTRKTYWRFDIPCFLPFAYSAVLQVVQATLGALRCDVCVDWINLPGGLYCPPHIPCGVQLDSAWTSDCSRTVLRLY